MEKKPTRMDQFTLHRKIWLMMKERKKRRRTIVIKTD